MTRKLTVSDVEKEFNGKLSARVRYDDIDTEIFFTLPSGFKPHSDMVACAFAAIFGSSFDEVHFLEPISKEIREKLAKITNSVWEAPIYGGPGPVGGNNVMLNFSGGFDSLAAKAVLGDEVKLVSIDFGGNFSREREFFQKFETEIISTNMREHEASWTFMGAGSILLREYHEADYFSFGNILEASPWHFLKQFTGGQTPPIFSCAGLTTVNPIIGMTEFLTAEIALKAFPNQILDSLVSLADIHTEKYLRKVMILEMVSRENNIDINFENVPAPTFKNTMTLGKSFAADFLAPGFVGNVEEEKISQWMDLSAGFFDKFDGRNSFYRKEISGLRRNIPRNLGAEIEYRKHMLGIEYYNGSDWDDFHEVINFIKRYYKFSGQTK